MSVYRPNSSKKMTSNFIPTSILSSQLSRAVLLIGIVLSFIHMTGILISVYYLVDRLMEPGKHRACVRRYSNFIDLDYSLCIIKSTYSSLNSFPRPIRAINKTCLHDCLVVPILSIFDWNIRHLSSTGWIDFRIYNQHDPYNGYYTPSS